MDSKVNAMLNKGLSTNDYTDEEKTKLAGIAPGATANSTDAVLKDRANHTGVQDISTVANLRAELDALNAAIQNGGGGGSGYTDAQAKIAGLAALGRVDISRYQTTPTTNLASTFQSIINDGNVVYVPPGKIILLNDALINLSASVPRCHIVNDGRIVCSKTSRALLVDQAFGTPVDVTSIVDIDYNGEPMTRIGVGSAAGLIRSQIIK
ncbi:hypothetical protein G3V96_24565, partial [Escherichia coli]|nr:hypothetical protein [Escherichia coli]